MHSLDKQLPYRVNQYVHMHLRYWSARNVIALLVRDAMNDSYVIQHAFVRNEIIRRGKTL